MIVRSLQKNKNNSYTATIDDRDYIFIEETILKYRLVENKEISKDDLDSAIEYNELMEFYSKALAYQIKYQKTESELYKYLFAKGISDNSINKIIDKLKEIKVLNDSKLIISYVDSLIRKYNGIHMIKQKLYQHGFERDLINDAINNIDYDLYYEYLNIIFNKTKNKYKDDPLIKK